MIPNMLEKNGELLFFVPELESLDWRSLLEEADRLNEKLLRISGERRERSPAKRIQDLFRPGKSGSLEKIPSMDSFQKEL